MVCASDLGRNSRPGRVPCVQCPASDALSGIASSTCSDINGPAYDFTIGTNRFSATAVDRADNAITTQVSFEVHVTFGGLCRLATRFAGQAGIAGSLCSKLQAAEADAARGNQSAKQGVLGAFEKEIRAQAGKALSDVQAQILLAAGRVLEMSIAPRLFLSMVLVFGRLLSCPRHTRGRRGRRSCDRSVPLGITCGPNQFCVHPAYGSDLVRCYEFDVPDGGCPHPFRQVSDCPEKPGPVCTYDSDPYCQDASPGCADSPSCATCSSNLCTCQTIANRHMYCCGPCPKGMTCYDCYHVPQF